MANTDSHPDNRVADTGAFVAVENEENNCDFAVIDEDLPFTPIVIDMSEDELAEVISVDFEENTGLDNFVTIDETPIFVSGFTGNDD
ncbi:MAG: hypothetical protein LBF08_01195 [Dysgonamonadaceae bacterium]|jgi:hypothetical protein|nr:hypothetical protein [Dysgonamonadaceae bacterium]